MRSRKKLRSSLQRQRVIVTMTDNQGFDGVLWAVDDSGMQLIASADKPIDLITVDNERHPVDDQVFVPADKVLFVQITGGV